MFDRQKAFDTAVNHMRKQGRVALAGAACAYRTKDGLKCAVGALIPDEAYDPVIEGRGASHPLIAEKIFGLNEGSDSEDVDFLWNLQLRLHDELRAVSSTHFMTRLELEIDTFAAEYGLTIPSKENTNV